MCIESSKYFQEKFLKFKILRDILYLWDGRLNIVQMLIFPKLKHRVDEITIRIAEVIFVEIKKLILTSIQKCKGPLIVKTTPKKKKKRKTRLKDLYYLVS